MKRWLRPLIGAAIGAAFLALLARRVDRDTVAALLAGARPGPLGLALGALALGLAARVVRWWLMLRALDPELPATACVRPFLGSLALNNTVPLRAGDVVRAVGFRRTLRAAPARVIGTLLIERVLDLLVLLVIFFAALLGAARVFPPAFLLAAGAAGVVALGALAVLIAVPASIGRVATRALAWSRLPTAWREPLAQPVRQLAESLALLRAPRRAAALLVLSLLAWTAEGGVFAAVGSSLGIEVPWPAAWLALGAATLATLLPSTPGYVGTFDWFATLGFTAYGLDRSRAAAAALLSHLVVWLPVTVVGLALLAWRPGRRPTLLEADPA